MLKYDYEEYLIAKKYIEQERLIDALQILENLYKYNRYDPIVIFEYAKCLINGNFNIDKGEYLLKKIDEIEKNEYAYIELGRLEKGRKRYSKSLQYYNKVVHNRPYALYEIILLYIKLEKYEKAYQLLNELVEINVDLGQLHKLKTLNFYLKNKLNILTEEDIYNIDNYYCKQIYFYERERAISHTRLHLYQDNSKKKHTLFNQNVNIEELFKECERYILETEPTSSTDVDKYYFDTEKIIATIDNNDTTKVMIICDINTNNILSIYPIRHDVIIKKPTELVQPKILQNNKTKF